MKAALILICDVPKYIKDIRKKYDYHKNIPAHTTLCFLKSDFNEKDLISKLRNLSIFNINLDKIEKDTDILYLKLENEKNLLKINNKIEKYIDKYPKSGYHLTLGLSKKKLYVPNKIIESIDIPIKVNIKKIWLMKKKDKDWYRSKTIFLK